MSRTAQRPDGRGVSLMEVLVVLGIIALLMGLLAPALSTVRMAGRGSLCQSNLRQMSIAAHAYANIHQAFPVALQYKPGDIGLTTVAWDWVITFDGELIGPGPLWHFTDNPHEVMQCPQYHGPSNAPGDPYTGYNYSPYLGGEQQLLGATLEFFPGVGPTHVRHPTRCAMFGLGGWASGANKFMRSPLHNEHSDLTLGPGTMYAGGQAFRYRGQTFTAFVDGHVGASDQPQPGENATAELLQQLDFPRNGFLSNDASAYSPR